MNAAHSKEVIHVFLSHNPDDFGAYVSGGEGGEEVVSLHPDEMTSGFEPPDKMENEDDAGHVNRMVEHLLSGGTLPPIYARKHEAGGYQVLDGHHRWTAWKKARSNTMPAVIVPPERISSDIEKI